MGCSSGASSCMQMAMLRPSTINEAAPTPQKVLMKGHVAHLAPVRLVTVLTSARRRAPPSSFTVRAQEDKSVVEQLKQGVESAVENTKEFLSGTQDKIGVKGEEGSDAMKKETNKASNSLNNTAEDARRSVDDATSFVEGKAKDVMSSIKTGADDIIIKAKSGLDDAKSNIDRQ